MHTDCTHTGVQNANRAKEQNKGGAIMLGIQVHKDAAIENCMWP